MELRFVTAENQDYLMLAEKLNEYYFTLVGDIQLRYAEENRPDNFECLVVAYENKTPVGCGCWKVVDPVTAEIKRIYVLLKHRRKGVATMLVRSLEEDIIAKGYSRIVLETARTTPASKMLYLSLGYRQIDYYGSPAGADNCLCFEKVFKRL